MASLDIDQRWYAGRHSFVRRRDGGFDPQRYRVCEIPEAQAKAYVEAHHYSKSWPAVVKRYGLFLDEICDTQLVGVCAFSVPTSVAVLRNAFPTLEPYRESIELGRLVLEGEAGGGEAAPHTRAPANSESWFVTRCLSDLAAGGYRGVVCFSDPQPRRRSDGSVLLAGHVGFVYQALGMQLRGRGTARTLTVLPDATVLNDRAAAKVRAQERGHDYVERRLVRLGARTPRPHEDMGRWLRDALEEIGARQVRHQGNWRYLKPIGGTRRTRAAVVLGGAAQRYPKRPDPEAA